MSAVSHNHDKHHHHHDHGGGLHNPQEPTRAEQVVMNRAGMWLFMLSESFLFIALLAARLYLWRDPELGLTRPALEQLPALIATIVLLVSSYFMNRAEVSIANGRMKDFSRSILMTAFLGTAFLIGVVGFEWGLFLPKPHILLTDGAFGAIFFGMTGLHALHVLIGIIYLMVIYFNSKRGLYTPHDAYAVESCALYWHYVDLVWVFFYPFLYLIGTAVHYHH
jgi:cytochrome c oxidase subunit III